MSDRKTEAYWSESQQRWQCLVQRDGQRRCFVSCKANSRPDCKRGKIEAEKKADAWIVNQTSDESTRCEKLLDRYYLDVKARTGTSNTRQVEQFIRLYIKPVIGRKKISSLSQGDMQDVINLAYAENHLADKSLRVLRAIETQFVKYCRQHNYTKLYPEGLTIPAGAALSDRKPLDVDGLKTLFSDKTTLWHRKQIDEPFIHAYRFAALTGLRPGELIGLKLQDIEGNIYHISRSINEYKEITTGKNRNAKRSGELGIRGQQILADQRRMLADRNVISLYVFPSEDGGPMTSKQYWNHWKRYCKAHSISEGTKPYELRHTFVSVNVEMPDALKKMVVGHSQNMDTEGVYGHRKKSDLAKAAGYIDSAFDEVLN